MVSANQFEENRDALRCVDGYNLCMTGNCLDDHLRDGVVIENTYGSVVAGNMIEECAGTAIVLDRDCYGITLSANVIAHETSGGIDLRDAHGCTVSANTFTIVKKNALVDRPVELPDHRDRQQLLRQLHRRRGGQARGGRPRRQRHHPERDLGRRRERERLLGRHPEGARRSRETRAAASCSRTTC